MRWLWADDAFLEVKWALRPVPKVSWNLPESTGKIHVSNSTERINIELEWITNFLSILQVHWIIYWAFELVLISKCDEIVHLKFFCIQIHGCKNGCIKLEDDSKHMSNQFSWILGWKYEAPNTSRKHKILKILNFAEILIFTILGCNLSVFKNQNKSSSPSNESIASIKIGLIFLLIWSSERVIFKR